MFLIQRVVSCTHVVGVVIYAHTCMCRSVEISVVCETFADFTGFHYCSSEKIHLLEVSLYVHKKLKFLLWESVPGKGCRIIPLRSDADNYVRHGCVVKRKLTFLIVSPCEVRELLWCLSRVSFFYWKMETALWYYSKEVLQFEMTVWDKQKTNCALREAIPRL